MQSQYQQMTEYAYIEGLVQGCSNSFANALELLQSCPKPWYVFFLHFLEKGSACLGLTLKKLWYLFFKYEFIFE